MENIKLNNGMVIPAVGFGCYNAKGGDNYQIILDAIRSGYTLLDTASVYETERDLGKAIKDSGVKREDLIIQSKLWIDEMGYEGAKAAIDRTLSRIGTDYLDIYFIHWPRQMPEMKGAPGHPEVLYDMPTYDAASDWKSLDIETYKALEELVDEGKIRAIGLSNFLPHHLQNILDNCRIKPVVDQLEVHLGYTQNYAVEYAKANDVAVEAWSPLGRSNVLGDEFFNKLADKYNVSVAQLGLRYLYQMGIVSLPKSASPNRQKQNLDIFDFAISEEDFHILSSMVPAYWQNEHPDYVIPPRGSKIDQ